MTGIKNPPSNVDDVKSAEPENEVSPHIPIVGIRGKLIIIFLLAKIIPLILLAIIAWRALISLGAILRETSVTDSREALTAMAVENIERISTDAAQKVAEFLYQRDADISFLSKSCENYDFSDPESMRLLAEEFFTDFGENKAGLIRKHGHWKIAEDGMSWIQVDPYVPPVDTQKRSVNKENEDVVDGASFRYGNTSGRRTAMADQAMRVRIGAKKMVRVGIPQRPLRRSRAGEMMPDPAKKPF